MLEVLLSLGAGGLLAEGGKFIFEKSIPELQRKKVTKKAKNKYSFDLAKLSMILHHEFNDLLSWIDAGGTRFDIHIGSGYDHQRLLILYHFGNFFAWCTVIDKEEFIQYSEQNKSAEEYQKMKHRPIFKIEFDFYYEDIMGSLSEFKNYQWLFDIRNWESVKASSIPQVIIHSIGDLMVKESKNDDYEEAAYESVKNYLKSFLLHQGSDVHLQLMEEQDCKPVWLEQLGVRSHPMP